MCWRTTHHPLFEGELLGSGYPEQCNGKNNICKGIYIAMKHYYKTGSFCSALQTGLISPIKDDIIDKVDDKCDTDQEGGIAKNVAIVMRDHEIDGIDTKDHYQKAIQHLVIRREIKDLPKNEVLDHPGETGNE